MIYSNRTHRIYIYMVSNEHSIRLHVLNYASIILIVLLEHIYYFYCSNRLVHHPRYQRTCCTVKPETFDKFGDLNEFAKV